MATVDAGKCRRSGVALDSQPSVIAAGEQSMAKLTCGLIQMGLKGDTSMEPDRIRDLMIAATNGWGVAYDNLSFFPGWVSGAGGRG